MKAFDKNLAIVTGGGSGIGRSLALALAKQGASVAVTDVNEQRANEVAGEIRGMGKDAWGIAVDHSDKEAVKKFADRFIKEHGCPDVMCLNAGVGHSAPLERITLEDWEWVLGVNLWGVIYMLHFFTPEMIKRQSGKILITSSLAGITPIPGMAPYCTSKFALVGLTESLSSELAAHNITVSAICPGYINTNIVRDGKIDLRDGKGASKAEEAVKFYATKGVSPDIVARDGLRALRRKISIMPTPLHAWPQYLLHRLSPSFYVWAFKQGWKRGLPFGR
ncbi:Short-chain dehydrogenase [Desulfatibacillum alkenivorans DSM 16219]|jgi:NAD(P)-dependent dehydrogenase (short-subunit alcohol dehydrogenase family)|uniref:Short-chain dehydrogenase n=1 Tax=Desulfatibacillum alkenivorans DSM 16219 TaxID=1121393 RepID=A0A1M6QP84_9BACT|nr:SDR family NAD(P)-dependent oxidoreductase [Desulfatibacillum alkenivorans]SHK21893.1 Short-chain dehydrogenase [Desulfatibacillum alkenivorans DSM 16219]